MTGTPIVNLGEVYAYKANPACRLEIIARNATWGADV